MKLPLIGLQTNPSGTASSPSSRRPPLNPARHPLLCAAAALSFLRGPHLLTTWFAEGCLLQAARPPPPGPQAHRPAAASPAPGPRMDGVWTHSHWALQGPQGAPLGSQPALHGGGRGKLGSWGLPGGPLSAEGFHGGLGYKMQTAMGRTTM